MSQQKYNKVSVIGGAGHIGLPLSCFMQNNGFEVVVIDNNLKSLNLLKQNILTFYEKDLEINLKHALGDGLVLTNDLEKISETEIVIVTIGTSSNKEHLELFKNLMNDVLEKISKESLLILRSTITLEDIELIQSNNNFINKNIKLAYCPERIAEGEAFNELKKLPQIVGTEIEEVYKVTKDIFKNLKIETISTTINNAIFTKLFTNSYRHANFSLANEFYNIAVENNIDFERIRELATIDYPRLKNFPFTGYVGGPCLPKDLETFIKSYNVEDSLLNHLEDVNDKFLNNIVQRCNKIFDEKKLILLGLSFKVDSDDIRGSGSIELYRKLKKEGFEIFPVDPLVNQEEIDFELFEFSQASKKTNNILIAVDHKNFKEFDLKDKKVFYVEI